MRINSIDDSLNYLKTNQVNEIIVLNFIATPILFLHRILTSGKEVKGIDYCIDI